MIKLPEELRNKLIYASELSPLDPPTTHCFCGKCADTLYDSLERPGGPIRNRLSRNPVRFASDRDMTAWCESADTR